MTKKCAVLLTLTLVSFLEIKNLTFFFNTILEKLNHVSSSIDLKKYELNNLLCTVFENFRSCSTL